MHGSAMQGRLAAGRGFGGHANRMRGISGADWLRSSGCNFAAARFWPHTPCQPASDESAFACAEYLRLSRHLIHNRARNTRNRF